MTSSRLPPHRRPALWALGLLSLVGVSLAGNTLRAQTTQSEIAADPVLASCTKYDDVYDDLFTSSEQFEQWADTYHAKVGAAIESLLEPVAVADCTTEQVGYLPATGPVREMAESLPPWKEDPAALAALSREDAGAVLLEFLRAYECALLEHNAFLAAEIVREWQPASASSDAPSAAGSSSSAAELPNMYFTLFREMTARQKLIAEELLTARPTLERALALASGLSRLQPFDSALGCVQRASLDLRNVMSLAADTSACLPRVWNARDVLRDMPHCNDGIDNDQDGDIDLQDEGCDSHTDPSE